MTTAVSELSIFETRVLGILGEVRCISAENIRKMLTPADRDVSNRNVRRAVLTLNARGYPIISTRRGFKLATTWDEVGAYRENLLKRMRRLADRISVLDGIEAIGRSRPNPEPDQA